MKRCLFILSMMFVGSLCVIADEYDDIYFNPNKKSEVVVNENTEVVNGRDVDEYNRFGGYYESEIDTIGSAISNGEDFVYTKQIQKYYNPTIVVDNAEVFDEVINSSYGNVEIVYNYGVPSLATWYSPYYSVYYSPYYYLPYYYYSPYSYWYSWAWGPTWAWYDPWYDPWYPGWGPSYPHHPHHPVGPGHHHHHAGHGGHHTNHHNDGWASNTRPDSHRHQGSVSGHRGGGQSKDGHRYTGGTGKGYRVNSNGFRDNADHRASESVGKVNNNRGGRTNDRVGASNSNSGRKTGVTQGANRQSNRSSSNIQRSGNTTRNNSGFNSGSRTNRSSSGSAGSSRGGSRGGSGNRGGGRHR